MYLLGDGGSKMAESPAIDGTGFPHTQRKFRNAGGWQMLRTWRRPGNGTPGHWLTMFCERYNDYSVIERQSAVRHPKGKPAGNRCWQSVT